MFSFLAIVATDLLAAYSLTNIFAEVISLSLSVDSMVDDLRFPLIEICAFVLPHFPFPVDIYEWRQWAMALKWARVSSYRCLSSFWSVNVPSCWVANCFSQQHQSTLLTAALQRPPHSTTIDRGMVWKVGLDVFSENREINSVELSYRRVGSGVIPKHKPHHAVGK